MKSCRFVLIGLLVLGISGASHAASRTEPSEWVVPSTMCGEYFLIPIEVNLDGDGESTTLMAIFDTGGNGLHIDPDAVVRAGGDPVQERRQITIRNAKAGPLTFGKLRPYTRQLDHLSQAMGIEIDVFLPFRTFDKFLLTLDFPNREIRVERGRLPRPDGVQVFNARGRDRRPYLETEIAGRAHRLLIDSGSSDSIALQERHDLPWVSEPLPISVTQGMERLNYRDLGRLGDDVEIGGVTIIQPLVTTGARTSLIGTDLMRRFAWTFDQQSKRVRIRPDSPDPLRLPARRGTGAVMIPALEGYEVARVLADTPADRAGLLAGDLVVAVDGESTLQQTCDRWKEEERSVSRLTVMRDGETFEVEVDLVDLVP